MCEGGREKAPFVEPMELITFEVLEILTSFCPISGQLFRNFGGEKLKHCTEFGLDNI